VTNKSFIIDLSNLPVHFKENEISSNSQSKESAESESGLKRDFPILEWIPILAQGDTPTKRRGHSIISIDEMLIVFGGCYLDEKCFNDVHIFELKSNTWKEQKTRGNKPKERAGHTATLFGSKMYVFAGGGKDGYLNDLYVLDIETVIFTQIILLLL
jgi:Galactose oxidase, central domain